MFTLAAAGWILAAIVMAALWFWHLRIGNAGVVDAGWALLVAGLAAMLWFRRRAVAQ